MARNVEFDERAAVSKAMEVFWKKGYNGASMRELTEAMGINSSSLYNTIGDKHQLFVRCIKNYTETRMDDAKKQIYKTTSPIKAIVNFINASVNAIISGHDSCLAIKTTFEVATDNADVQAVLKADSDFTHYLLSEMINEAIALGEIPGGNDPEMLADFMVSAFTGWHEAFILHRNPARIKRMAKFLIEKVTT